LTRLVKAADQTKFIVDMAVWSASGLSEQVRRFKRQIDFVRRIDAA
jgi:hypothetical protein